jgi:hypothetical protein
MEKCRDILLTDDEIVAVAADAGTPWPSRLPTVDVSDDAALTAAAQRGWRSLSVRELSSAPVPIDRLHPIFTARPIVETYLADDQLVRLDGATASIYYRTPDQEWIVEVTTAIGVHAYRFIGAAAAATLLEEALDSAVTAGPPTVSSAPGTERQATATGFCLLGRVDGALRVLTANRGGLAVAEFADDRSPAIPLPAPQSAAAALALIGLSPASGTDAIPAAAAP